MLTVCGEFLGELNHFLYKGKENFDNGFRCLVVGGNAGDSAIYLADQLKNKNAEIIYLDLNRSSMEVVQKRAEIRGLKSIKWVNDSILNIFINSLKDDVIIIGDLNLNSTTDTVRNYFCYFLTYCGMKEMNEVLHEYGGRVDVALIGECKKATVTKSSISGIVRIDPYHPPLDISYYFASADSCRRACLEPSNIAPTKDWNFNKADYTLISDLLTYTCWDNVTQAKDVRVATQQFYSILYEIFDIAVPRKKRSKNKCRRYPTWFTPHLILDLNRKIRLHREWKTLGSTDTYKRFSDLRAELKLRISSAYDAYILELESNIVKNPRQFWQHASNLRSKGGFEASVTYKGKIYTGPATADAFADYFASVFLPGRPLLDAYNIGPRSLNTECSCIDIPSISPSQVSKGIKSLKPTSSAGPDSVPTSILKLCSRNLCYPLCHIINLALQTGVYPEQWKQSLVTPIPKSSDKSSVEEYRPIAVLNTPAKIFERVIHTEIYRQIDSYLCNEQHGFRKGRSVDTNLIAAVDYISDAMDCGLQVDVLYFDFRKAFDRIDNDVLLSKLQAIGFTPRLLKLFADYLRDRQQFVRHGCYTSQSYHTRSGVSQGSILGPLLFLIMINDLPKVVNTAKCLLYADDLKLVFKIRDSDDCIRLQKDVDAVFKWSIENGMLFNASKCFVVTFGRNLYSIFYPYSLDGCTIARVTEMKDLGVTFDRKLTFHEHIRNLTKECFKRLGFVLRNARDFRNPTVIKLLYTALVRSKLEASSCVWNPHEASYILMLEKVQKVFLRYLYKRVYGYYPYLYPTVFILGSLGFNSLNVRRILGRCAIALKILRGTINAPELHDQLCRLFVPDRYLRCGVRRRHRLLAPPPARTAHRAASPVCHMLTTLNAFLEAKPDCDLFADGWVTLMYECLLFCEVTYECESSIG